MAAVTKRELASMIEAVQQSPEDDEVLAVIAEGDLMVISWICRCVSPEALAELRRRGSEPLWQEPSQPKKPTSKTRSKEKK